MYEIIIGTKTGTKYGQKVESDLFCEALQVAVGECKSLNEKNEIVASALVRPIFLEKGVSP